MYSIKTEFEILNKEIFPWEVVSRKGYGYEPENPIMVYSVQAIYNFIAKLTPTSNDLEMFLFKDRNKVESIYLDEFEGPVDHFEIVFREFTKKSAIFRIYDLFFCAYPRKGEIYSKVDIAMSMLAENDDNTTLPEGFALRK